MKNFKRIVIIYSIFVQSLVLPTSYADDKVVKNAVKSNFNIKELAFPSELKKLSKKGGAIYYSPSVKDKVLIPVHFWGQIKNSGLHFVPVDTNLVKGLSMAGGPTGSANLSKITLTRLNDNKINTTIFDLGGGGTNLAHSKKLLPGDTVFVNKSNFEANRSYYTGLIAVFATVLSSILLYRQVRKNNNQ